MPPPDADAAGAVVAAAVAALLPSHGSPGAVERAVVAELRRQSPHWRRSASGAWSEIRVCAACGIERITDCPKGVPPECASERRREITVAMWGSQHNGDGEITVAQSTVTEPTAEAETAPPVVTPEEPVTLFAWAEREAG